MQEKAPLFFGRVVEDDTNLFKSDEAAVDHFVEAGKDFFDALGGLDDFKDDREILREAKQLRLDSSLRPASLVPDIP